MYLRRDKVGRWSLVFGMGRDGEDWKVLTIGQEQFPTTCHHSYDCCGKTYCRYVEKFLFGLIQIGDYYINI